MSSWSRRFHQLHSRAEACHPGAWLVMEDPLMESDMYTLWLGVGPSPPQVSDAIAHWAGKTREEALDRAEVELEAVLSERALAGSPTA